MNLQICDGQHYEDHAGHDGDGRGAAELELAHAPLVDQDGQVGGGLCRAAGGQQVDQVIVVEGPDGAEDEQHQGGALQVGEGYVQEGVEGGGAVNGGGLVLLLGDGPESAPVGDHGEGEETPDAYDYHEGQGQINVAQRGGIRRDHAKLLHPVADNAPQVVEHPLPGESGGNDGENVGDEQGGTEEGDALHILVYQQRCHKAEEQLAEDRAYGPQHIHIEGLPEGRILQLLSVVFQPYEGELAGEVVYIVKRNPEIIKNRVDYQNQ